MQTKRYLERHGLEIVLPGIGLMILGDIIAYLLGLL